MQANSLKVNWRKRVDICPNFWLKKKRSIFVSSLVLPAGPSSPYSGERASRTTGSVTSFFHCNNHVTSNFHIGTGN